jgi:hypothetical protein
MKCRDLVDVVQPRAARSPRTQTTLNWLTALKSIPTTTSTASTTLTHEGYRELPSAAEMRKLLNRKIVEQNGICPICDESLQTTEMLFRITNDAKGWEERGETIIQTWAALNSMAAHRNAAARTVPNRFIKSPASFAANPISS